MRLYAHITTENEIRKEQTLEQHSKRTAHLAGESLKSIGLYYTAFLAGLIHDMGKATEKFNIYLDKSFNGEPVKKGSVNHTFAGVIYLLEKYHKTPNAENLGNYLTSEIISWVIGSHHGIFDCVDLDCKDGFQYRLDKDRKEICYEEAKFYFNKYVISEQEIEEHFNKASEEIYRFFDLINNDVRKNEELYFQIGILNRLILSALIYADRKDTREFMNNTVSIEKYEPNWKKQREYLEEKISCFDYSSQINQVRKIISEQCLAFSDNPTGIYRLNVPTGGGKTLSSLRYALAHAEKYNKKRIIFIIPLLSILDQNAKIIKNNIADKDLVIEHHSNVVFEDMTDIQNEDLEQYELLTENWDSPIIVSTMVQLLNIFFSHKTTTVSRMRALSDSVIIIDEIQSLPKKVTLMFNCAINFLSKYCNSTIILSSATQPCLEEVDWKLQYAPNPDMVSLTEEQLAIFKRANIIDKTTKYGMELDECVTFCEKLSNDNESLLLICNTKNEAREIFEKLQKQIIDENVRLFHLSTSMCQKHRKAVLTDIQNELNFVQNQHTKDIKIICVATQLVEAGVDFSFKCVVRVMAGIDNLAQATGRCNRSNEYKEKGTVYLINLKNENLKNLMDIQSAQISTLKVLEENKSSEEFDLIGEYATNIYYKYLYREVKEELKYCLKGKNTSLTALLANKVDVNKHSQNNYIMHYPFKSCGELFNVFEENTIDVIVPYGEGKEIITKLRENSFNQFSFDEIDKLIKQAKAYTINVFKWQVEKLMEYGYLEVCCDNRIYVLNSKMYSSQFGLGRIKEQEVEEFII